MGLIATRTPEPNGSILISTRKPTPIGGKRDRLNPTLMSGEYANNLTALNIPEGFRVEAMAAVGKPGDPSALPEALRERESPGDRRKLEQTVCEGPFAFRN